jgi:hypothetical protein
MRSSSVRRNGDAVVVIVVLEFELLGAKQAAVVTDAALRDEQLAAVQSHAAHQIARRAMQYRVVSLQMESLHFGPIGCPRFVERACRLIPRKKNKNFEDNTYLPFEIRRDVEWRRRHCEVHKQDNTLIVSLQQ